jgi:hypothetical protein
MVSVVMPPAWSPVHNQEFNSPEKGDMTSFSTADVLAFTRISELDTVFVIDNLRNTIVTYDVPAEFENTVWQDAFNESEVTLADIFNLEAFQYIVLVK